MGGPRFELGSRGKFASLVFSIGLELAYSKCCVPGPGSLRIMEPDSLFLLGPLRIFRKKGLVDG